MSASGHVCAHVSVCARGFASMYTHQEVRCIVCPSRSVRGGGVVKQFEPTRDGVFVCAHVDAHGFAVGVARLGICTCGQRHLTCLVQVRRPCPREGKLLQEVFR